MRSSNWILVAMSALALVLLVPASASACEVCFGASDAPAVKGMNNAILFLLGVIGLVQIGFVKLFWEFRKRSRALSETREKFRILEGGLK